MNSEPSVRLQQVSEMFQHAISQMLIHDLNDPNLRGARITQIVFTPDLKLAKIYYYSEGGEDDAARILKGFVRSKNFIRKELGVRVPLKFSPELKFYYDNTFDEKLRIDTLFQQIEAESKTDESQND